MRKSTYIENDHNTVPTSSEILWIKKRGPVGVGTRSHIHTDPDCQPLQQATEIWETIREKRSTTETRGESN